MLLRSSVLLICIPILVCGFHSAPFSSGYPAVTGSVIALGLRLIGIVLVNSSQADHPRLVRQKWCDWTAWSRCSPEPCHAGIRRTPRSQAQKLDSADSDEEKTDSTVTQVEGDEVGMELATNYCVVKPGPRNNRDMHPLLVQVTIEGVVKRREPAKQRTRTCACQSISFLRIFGLYKKDECSPNTIQVECGQCSQGEKVYQTRRYEFDESVLPFCEQSVVVSTQLYKILGGIAGAVIIVLFVVWVVRMLVRTVCRTSSTSSTSGGRGGGFVRRIDRDRGGHEGRRGRSSRDRTAGDNDTTDPLQMTVNVSHDSDLPPSYKDVVLNIPGVVFMGSDTCVEMDQSHDEPRTDRFMNRLRKPRSSSGRGHGDRQQLPQIPEPQQQQQIASSSTTIIQGRTKTPPPPSYEDVMSSPTMEVGNLRGETFHLVEMPTRTSVDAGSGGGDSVGAHAAHRTEPFRNRMVHFAETAGSGGGVTSPSQTHAPQLSTETHNQNLPSSIVEATAPD